ncbi:MAG: hypothetical protein EXS00_04025 [Phycisphaerales bacterium]|nr:hypothetical protein [Phycisphaerales bacterium]
MSTPTPASSNRPSAPRQQRAAPTRVDPVRLLRQNVRPLLIALGGGAVLGVIVHFASIVIYPVYSGQVLFELKPQLEGAREIQGRDTTVEETVIRLAQTEAARMTSRNVLLEACKNPDIESTDWSQWFLDDNGEFLLEDAVDELEDDLAAGHRRGTQIFYLSWSARRAIDVPVVLNTIAKTYLRLRNTADETKYAGTRGVFVHQRDELDRQISSLKTEMSAFIAKHNIPSFEENAMQTQRGIEDLMMRVSETTRDLTLDKARQKIATAKIEGAAAVSDDDRRRAEQDHVIAALRTDAGAIATRLAGAKRRFSAEHPEVISLERLNEASAARVVSATEDAVKRMLQAEYKEVSDRVVGEEALLTKQMEELAKERTRIETLAMKVSELELAKTSVEQAQLERAGIQQLIGELDVIKVREDARRVEIVQEALTPRELTFPQPEIVIPGVAFLVLTATVGVLFAREILDQRIRTTADLAALPVGRTLGVVPDLEDDPTQPEEIASVVRLAPNSVTAESLRQLVTTVSKSLEEGHLSSLAVFSATPESGTTSLITNLAASHTAIGKRVLVIDANFRRPGLASMMGLSDDAVGVGDVLSGKSNLVSAVQVAQGGVSVLSAGTPRSRVLEQLYAHHFDELIASAKSAYDLVIVDAAPAMVANETLVLANKVDATIVVVRSFQDQRGLVFKLVVQLAELKSRFLGVVLNRPRTMAGGYYRKNMETMAAYTTGAGTSAEPSVPSAPASPA